MTGCVLTVALSSSAGPSSTSFHKSCPSASEAAVKTSRTPLESAKGFIMPTDCDPCPGKTKANFTALPPRQRRAPGEAAAHGFHEHVLPGPDAAVAHRLVERQRDRRGDRK